MPTSTAARRSSEALRPGRGPEYELRVLPRGDLGYGIALYRLPPPAPNAVPDPEPVIRVWGDPLLGVMDRLLATIRRAGYRTTDLRATRRAPFRIGEEDAVHLGLLFAALKPLRKHRRIEEVARAISAMEREEAYYWFSKVTTGPEHARVCRALRIMASDE